MIDGIVLDMGCARTCFTKQISMIYAAGVTSTADYPNINGIDLHLLMNGSGSGLHKEKRIRVQQVVGADIFQTNPNIKSEILQCERCSST